MTPHEGAGGSEVAGEGSAGRHGRARELAERQAKGEDLGDYDARVLAAHLEACSDCRDWVSELPGEAAKPDWKKPERADDLDAMGKPRRRKVIGETYGPTKTRQIALYVAFVAVIAAVFFGGKLAIDKLDKPPEHIEAQAPWAQPDSPQLPPQQFQ